ncbi:ketopantoate reductase family protein [Marinomonas transparens]|uniref:2-dehydropantoate 2-reductase n=1 Tax=Marinomonas transparens TaxID=2795388 RepID=A0A934N2T7_9GAMM|nr:2-dehydropantoate 2-reductase [Marinomonas transparens]MBJ7539032.1 2-dehydropantoate 2-reductase [Marinomonas transparens]
MKKPQWLIVGAGAIGLFWACKLQKLGYSVHLVYRSTSPKKKITLEALANEDGQQKITSSEHKIKSFLAQDLSKQYDKVLLCTKAYDLVDAFKQVSDHVTEDATIACLCNGMGAQAALQKALMPKQILWAGTTSEGVLKINENHIKHTGLGDTYFGQWLKDTETKDFPLDSFVVPNIHQRLIEKLAVNAAINPLTALFSIHNGDLLEEQFHPLLNATLTELASVFTNPKFIYAEQSKHLTLDNLTNRVNTVAQLTRLNRSSMYEDFRLQRPTENEFISGFLVENSPVELPIQSLLYNGIDFPLLSEEIKKKLLSMT